MNFLLLLSGVNLIHLITLMPLVYFQTTDADFCGVCFLGKQRDKDEF